MNDIWAAGFFDGEGCISIDRIMQRKNICHRLHVSFSQKSRPILDALQEEYGGGISGYSRPSGQHGNLVFTGPKAVVFLKRILPYLKMKGVEAQLGLDFEELRLKTTARPLDIEDIAQRDVYYWALREAKE